MSSSTPPGQQPSLGALATTILHTPPNLSRLTWKRETAELKQDARDTSTPGGWGDDESEDAGKYPVSSFCSIRLQRDCLLNLRLDLQLE